MKGLKHVEDEKIAQGNCEMATVFRGIYQNTAVTFMSFEMLVPFLSSDLTCCLQDCVLF